MLKYYIYVSKTHELHVIVVVQHFLQSCADYFNFWLFPACLEPVGSQPIVANPQTTSTTPPEFAHSHQPDSILFFAGLFFIIRLEPAM